MRRPRSDIYDAVELPTSVTPRTLTARIKESRRKKHVVVKEPAPENMYYHRHVSAGVVNIYR